MFSSFFLAISAWPRFLFCGLSHFRFFTYLHSIIKRSTSNCSCVFLTLILSFFIPEVKHFLKYSVFHRGSLYIFVAPDWLDGDRAFRQPRTRCLKTHVICIWHLHLKSRWQVFPTGAREGHIVSTETSYRSRSLNQDQRAGMYFANGTQWPTELSYAERLLFLPVLVPLPHEPDRPSSWDRTIPFWDSSL